MMKVKHITMLALGSVATVGLTGCSEGEDGKPGFFERFYGDFIAPLLGEKAEEPRKAMAPLGVSVMNMQKATVPVYATWFGQLRGMEQADIRPEVAGKIVHQVYMDGSPCEKDDVLFQIDDETYKAAVNMARANLDAAKAAVDQARVADEQAQQDVARYSPLVGSGSVSEKTFMDAEHAKKRTAALLVAAEAHVNQAAASLENAEINLKRCTIKAPFKGYASAATVSVGDYVAPGGAVLARMSAIDPIRVDFMVTGKHVLDIVTQTKYEAEKGMASPFTQFDVILEDGSLYKERGTVKFMDSEVNPSTGTVSFIGEIPNSELRLRSGASVQVRAKIGEVKDAFLVPKNAILSSMNHRFIYVVGKDQQPYGIDVILGPETMMDMPNGDGTTVKMPMQAVTARSGKNEAGEERASLEKILADLGYDNPLEAPVIVEGGQMAQIYATANMGMKKQGIPAGFGIVDPNRTRPFVYTPPSTTTPSITAKKAMPVDSVQK